MLTDEQLDIPDFLRRPRETRTPAEIELAARIAGAARPAARPTEPPPAPPAPEAGSEDAAIRAEADRRWRDWRPGKIEGKTRLVRPRLTTFVRLVRREYKLAAREAARNAKRMSAAAPKRKAGAAAAAPAPSNAAAPKPNLTANGKVTELIKLLARSSGATVAELCAATGWKPHTLRARLSGLAKPCAEGGQGLAITRSRAGNVTSYRIEQED